MEEALRKEMKEASRSTTLHIVDTEAYSSVAIGVSMNNLCSSIIQIIMAIIEIRDAYTARHMRRVSEIAYTIAEKLGLPAEQIAGLHLAALVHDIGKISIPADILCKPSRLSDQEYELIKTHSYAGYQVLKDIETPWPLARIVLEHHERMDGTGYPNGIGGEEILLESRIIAVADVVDAITSHRPYRPSLGKQTAISELQNNKGTLYDYAVVDACLEAMHNE